MTGEAQAHETSTSMVKAALAELDAGTDMALIDSVLICVVEIAAQGAIP